jgi:ATP-binding cassette, subfamily B, bacterial MsbA
VAEKLIQNPDKRPKEPFLVSSLLFDGFIRIFNLGESLIFRTLFHPNLAAFALAIALASLGAVLEATSIFAVGPLLKALHEKSPDLSAFEQSVPLKIAFPVLAMIIPIKIALVLLSRHVPNLVSRRVTAQVRKQIIENLIWSDSRWKGRLNVGETIKRVDDSVYWATEALLHSVIIVTGVITLAALFGAMVYISPAMSIASIGFFALMNLFARVLNRKIAKNFASITRESSGFYNLVCDIAQAFPLIRSFNAGPFFSKLASDRIEPLRVSELRAGFNLRASGYTTEFFAFFFLLFNFFILWGGWISIPFSAFLVFFYTAYRAIQTLKEITLETSGLVKCREHAALVDPLLNVDLAPTGRNADPWPPLRRKLEISNLKYSYSDGKQVLKGLNLTVRRGEKIAIMGDSGAGKSTLLSLLVGLTDPTSGSIKVDGVEVRPRSKLADISLLIPQESFVFKLTIAENIAMSPEFNRAKVEEALRRVNLWSFIEDLPKGIHTRLGEEGTGLSVGQKQRLAIARALYCDSELLIMDEPNSSLDSENSCQVMREVFDLFREKTIVIVTHFEDFLPYFDRILVLKDGTFVPRAVPHRDLLPSHPVIADFHR